MNKTVSKFISKGITGNGSPALVVLNIALNGYAFYSMGKGAVKAYKIVQKEKPKTKKELVQKTWKCFVVPATLFSGAVACSIAGYRLNAKKQAAILSAATISETALQGITKHLGEETTQKKVEKVVDRALQEQAEAKMAEDGEIIDTGKGNVLMVDTITGQRFRSDCEVVRAAKNTTNEFMNSDGYVSFNYFLEEAGMHACEVGDVYGWSANHEGLFDVSFVGGATPYKGEPYLILKYSPRPQIGYDGM